LNLLRDFASRPTQRPVMVFFGGADSIEFAATRQMFMALSDIPSIWQEQISGDDESIDALVAALDRHAARIATYPDDPTKSNPKDRQETDRIVKLIETDMALEQDQLFRLGVVRKEEMTPEIQAQLQALEDRQVRLSRLKFAFQPEQRALTGDEPRQYI